MKYYLSESDKRVLSQTINTVNNLPTSVQGGKRPTIKPAFAYAELTAQDENGLWSAYEVYFDETGTPNELTDGRVWGLDAPSIVVNGTVSAGQVMRVERYYLIDSEGKEQPVWVGSAVGGGASIFRIKCLQNSTISYDGSNSNFSLIDNDDLVIESNVTVTQRKFTTADFYENEILYAQADEVGYDLSPFLAGIGGTSA